MPVDGVRPGLLPVPAQGATRPMFRTLGIAASGLSAQRQRIETIAQNIANADVPTSADGTGGYKRRTLVMKTATQANAAFGVAALPGIAGTIANPVAPYGSPPFAVPAPEDASRRLQVPFLPLLTMGQNYGVTVTGVVEDQSEGRRVYEPANPAANADGYVSYPDIDTSMEQVNMYDAKRIYEANASVFQVAKSMLRAAIDI